DGDSDEDAVRTNVDYILDNVSHLASQVEGRSVVESDYAGTSRAEPGRGLSAYGNRSAASSLGGGDHVSKAHKTLSHEYSVERSSHPGPVLASPHPMGPM